MDNHSPEDPVNVIQPLLEKYPSANIVFKRNLFNIGTVPNILRCFEVASAPWVLTLGDDDDMSADAVNTMLSVIKENNDAEFIHFSTADQRERGERPRSFNTYGSSGLINGFDSVGALNFMSVSVWKREFACANVLQAYRYAYSMSPHTLCLSVAWVMTKNVISVIR